MNTKIGFVEIDSKLRSVNDAINTPLDMYRVVKKYQSPGYEIHRRVGNGSAFENMTGDIGLTKEGVMSCLCFASNVRVTPKPAPHDDFDSAINEATTPKTGATPEQTAAFDKALADMLSDDEPDEA